MFTVTKNAMVGRRVVLFKNLGSICDLDLKLHRMVAWSMRHALY